MTAARTMVFAGDFGAASTERGLANGFRALGWIVHEVPVPNTGRPRTILQRAAGRALRASFETAYRADILEACRVVKPDVFLTVKGISLSRELIDEINRLDIATAMYFPDYYFQQRGVSEDSFRIYRYFVTTKSFQLEYLSSVCGEENLHYVPHGYVGHVHTPLTSPMSEERYERDVLYIGNHSEFKQSWMRRLIQAAPDLDLTICGARWQDKESAVWGNHVRTSPPRYGVAYSRMVQWARINIALHMGPSKSGWADLVSTRTFEIPACGGFMLHVDNDEVREFFAPGVEIDVFSSVEELRDKIAFYLARPDLRAKMIARAFERCVPAYSYDARARTIDSIITKSAASDPDSSADGITATVVSANGGRTP